MNVTEVSIGERINNLPSLLDAVAWTARSALERSALLL